jgi:endoglycosylceramidase
MIDEYGRVRIFHGVNAVYKVAPYAPVFDHFDPQESLSIEDVSNLYNWGFNFVRLGTMWPGLEPVKGQYNTSYLAQLEEIVNALGQKDIVTLLDCHQDVLAPQYCGEGVPAWAAIPSPGSLPFPLPALGLDTLPLNNQTGCDNTVMFYCSIFFLTFFHFFF